MYDTVQCNHPCFPKFLFNSTAHNILSADCFSTQPTSKKKGGWVSYEMEMNHITLTIINSRTEIGRSGDRTSDLLFSCPLNKRLIYRGTPDIDEVEAISVKMPLSLPTCNQEPISLPIQPFPDPSLPSHGLYVL